MNLTIVIISGGLLVGMSYLYYTYLVNKSLQRLDLKNEVESTEQSLYNEILSKPDNKYYRLKNNEGLYLTPTGFNGVLSPEKYEGVRLIKNESSAYAYIENAEEQTWLRPNKITNELENTNYPYKVKLFIRKGYTASGVDKTGKVVSKTTTKDTVSVMDVLTEKFLRDIPNENAQFVYPGEDPSKDLNMLFYFVRDK
jgi:hypothetical protein